jgi:hypothetical protein
MFIDSRFAVQNNMQNIEKRTETNQNNRPVQGFQSEERRNEEMIMHLHMKNRKKYTHLYQLEKYFR